MKSSEHPNKITLPVRATIFSLIFGNRKSASLLEKFQCVQVSALMSHQLLMQASSCIIFLEIGKSSAGNNCNMNE